MPKGHLYKKARSLIRKYNDSQFEVEKRELRERMCRGFKLTKKDVDKILKEMKIKRAGQRKVRLPQR